MGALNERIRGTLIPIEDPAEVTRNRRETNEMFGIERGPSKTEIDLYTDRGLTPPTD